MKRTVLRVYDRNETTSLQGEKCFVVLPENYEYFDDIEYPLDWLLSRISSMGWQDYTSYMYGTAELEEDELYWCEIVGGECKETCIDISRVTDVKKYRLSWC